MRDNTLVNAMKRLSHQVVMLPMYTPLRVDEESASEEYVFYGGIKAYILQQFPSRSPWRTFLLKFAGAQFFTRLLTHFDIGSAVDPKANAELTLSMLRGVNGNQGILLEEMIAALTRSIKPQLIHITNTLISGPASEMKQALGIPVVCGLHGEDIFLDGLPGDYRERALDLIRANAAAIDHFIATSHYYADYYGALIGIDPARITVVYPGISLTDYAEISTRSNHAERPLTIGYLARMAPEKGLHLLVEAFIRLVNSGKFPGLRLKIAGYESNAYGRYIQGVRNRLEQAGVGQSVEMIGTVNRQQKLDFFKSIDIFSLPTVYREPKGLPALEALANGVPVVLPEHGTFPELVQATQGGLLHQPENPAHLAEKLETLLTDSALRTRLGEQGRAAVHAHFSAERMALETVQVYQNLVPQA